jgi:hypothetical protein
MTMTQTAVDYIPIKNLTPTIQGNLTEILHNKLR